MSIEWEETDYDLVNNDTMFVRGLRGGAFHGAGLSSSLRSYQPPAIGEDNIGFRVASVIPEPTTLFMSVMTVTCLLSSRRAHSPRR